MASRAFRELEALADRRRDLRSELEALELELRDATVDAVRSGVPAAPAARLAGVSRETLYKWLRSNGVATDTLALERRLEARLSVLDRAHDRRVKDVMGELEPAGDFSRRGNWRSGYQWEQAARNVSRAGGSAKAQHEEWARRELERRAEPVMVAELEEAEEIRRRLLELRAGFFADV